MGNNKKKKVLIISLIFIILIFLVLALTKLVSLKEKTIDNEKDVVSEVIKDDVKKEENEAEKEVSIEEVTLVEEEKELKDNEYWVNFLNVDGSVLQRTVYAKGTLPKYNGKTPEYSDGIYKYTFTGWDKKISTVKGTQTYKAVYSTVKLDNHTCNNFAIQDDGSWICKSCHKVLTGTDSSYITILKNGQPTTIQSLSVDDSNTFSYDSTNAEDVVIRTTGQKLVINNTNSNSHQLHYGYSPEADITTASNCTETHATIGEMTIRAGKMIANSNAFVGLVKATSTTIGIEEKNGGIVVIPTNVAENDIASTVASSIKYKYDNVKSKYIIDSSKDTNGSKQTKVNESDTIIIKSASDLISFRNKYNTGSYPSDIYGSLTIKLANNINISNIDWAPIGNWLCPFHGTFDGNNKTITGLSNYYSDSNKVDGVYAIGRTDGDIVAENVGFFGIVGNGDVTIKDVTFDKVNINNKSARHVGTVIGYAPSSDIFNGSDPQSKTATEIIGNFWQGNTTVGISNITLKNVNAYGDIVARGHVGGLIGKFDCQSIVKLESCNTKLNITSSDTGGLAGLIGYAKLTAETLTGTECGATIDDCHILEDSSLNYTGTNAFYLSDYCAGEKNIYASSGNRVVVKDNCTSSLSTVNLENQVISINNYSTKEFTFSSDDSITVIRNYGKLLLSDGEFNNSDTKDGYIRNEKSGSLSVSGGVFNISVTNNGNINISGGTFNKSFTNNGTGTISKPNEGVTLVFNDKVINSNDNENVSLSINGGTYKAKVSNASQSTMNIKDVDFSEGSSIDNSGTLTIETGTFTGKNINNSGAELTIKDGEFGPLSTLSNSGTATIEDGSFLAKVTNKANSTMTIKSGSLSGLSNYGVVTIGTAESSPSFSGSVTCGTGDGGIEAVMTIINGTNGNFTSGISIYPDAKLVTELALSKNANGIISFKAGSKLSDETMQKKARYNFSDN